MKKTNVKIQKLLSVFPSQRDFAEKIGVTQRAVSSWLSGAKSPSRRTLHAIADALGIPRETLTDDSIPLDVSAIHIRSQIQQTSGLEDVSLLEKVFEQQAFIIEKIGVIENLIRSQIQQTSGLTGVTVEKLRSTVDGLSSEKSRVSRSLTR